MSTPPDPENPTLFGTQKDYAWDAWQKAFDAGKALPDHELFISWWEIVALKTTWRSTHEMMQAAWRQGQLDRFAHSTGSFNSWWQEILDSQPKTSP